MSPWASQVALRKQAGPQTKLFAVYLEIALKSLVL